MSSSISYSKYPSDGQPTYNGGNFMSNDQASTVGCAGTSCKTLAANSVFTDPIDQGQTLAPAPGCGMSGGKRRKRKSTKKHKSKRHMKAKRTSRKSAKRSMRKVRRRQSTKKHAKKSQRSRSRRHRRYTMKGGAKNQQLMGNICHSAGYSIGPLTTEIKPSEVGLAAGHFTPYTKSQNN